MIKNYETTINHSIEIDSVALADAFKKAKNSYGPREKDLHIEDYATELISSYSSYTFKIKVDGVPLRLREIGTYLNYELYYFIYNIILNEFINLEKKAENAWQIKRIRV